MKRLPIYREFFYMKHLLLELVEKAVKKNDWEYSIDYDFYETYQDFSQDLTKVCNTKKSDQYVGVNNLDECVISFREKQSQEDMGYILWSNWNSGTERVADYSINLDNELKLSQVLEAWDTETSVL
jgi:hypothetical protein